MWDRGHSFVGGRGVGSCLHVDQAGVLWNGTDWVGWVKCAKHLGWLSTAGRLQGKIPRILDPFVALASFWGPLLFFLKRVLVAGRRQCFLGSFGNQ